MSPANVTGIVYHGTDTGSAESIRRLGLNEDAWTEAANSDPDPKGFSVTTDRSTAEKWARVRADERGDTTGGVVLQADAADLPLHEGSPGEWTDPDEYFVPVEYFNQVGPGVIR